MYFFYFYPLGLGRNLQRRPVLSYLMMAVMLVSFIWSHYFPQYGPVSPRGLVFYPGNGAPLTVISAVFMHASWLHLLGNLLYFQAFAPSLESFVGPFRFGLYFLLVGVFGNLAHGVVSTMGWLGQAGIGVLGASGAIAGLMAFSMICFRGARLQIAWWVFAPLVGQNKAGKTRIHLIVAAMLWLVLQLVQTMVAAETGAQVSFGAHLGGFAMGLVLALCLGYWTVGRSESMRIQALDYFQDGQYYAASGSWTEYLELNPGDIEGMLGLARSQLLSGHNNRAVGSFHAVYNKLIQQRQIHLALDVFAETRRNGGWDCFGNDELARVAHYREKQGDYQGAYNAFKQLYNCNSQGLNGQRALARIIHLCQGKLNEPDEADRWLEIAKRDLPDGGWRNYLKHDFSQATEPCATDSADLPVDQREPVS